MIPKGKIMLTPSNRFKLMRVAFLFGALLVLSAHLAFAQKEVYVGNLSYQITEGDLSNLLNK
jgi:hypothetical protein